MTRAEEVCGSLPSWMLRSIVKWPARSVWWWAAWIELWRRHVEAP